MLVIVNSWSEPVLRNNQEGGDAGMQPALQTGSHWDLKTFSDCVINLIN